MPNTSGGSKKNNEASQKKDSGGGAASERSKARKRKRCEVVTFSDSDLESEFDDCNMEDAMAIERKLRKVAKTNSLSDDEMRKLLQKFVKNDHVLALVSLKAEGEMTRERLAEEQRAIIFTDTPSVLKLTRAKARELNKTPGLTLPSLSETPQKPDIMALVKDDLHSDEEDEEYTFKEEDFISDDDPNTTVSDMDSNPRTPQTPLTTTEYEDSPVKLTDDGCFKIPLVKGGGKDTQAETRIATRTRSKFCLQQTTIEDLQSEFVPPDVEQCDVPDMDVWDHDEDWMGFLIDYTKPLNTIFVGDDDDPINDPEYVAAEKVPDNAEELRDVNISKKEVNDLFAALFDEGVSLESIELETPQKFILNNAPDKQLSTPRNSPPAKQVTTGKKMPTNATDPITQVTRQIDFEHPAPSSSQISGVSDTTINSRNVAQNDYTFNPDVMSTLAPQPPPLARLSSEPPALVPIGSATLSTKNYSDGSKTITLPASALNSEPELIAVPVPGQPNCFRLAKVLASGDALSQTILLQSPSEKLDAVSTAAESTIKDTRYTTPYDSNFTYEYISIKKHVYSEYMHKFENLRHAHSSSTAETVEATVTEATAAAGFTTLQHDLLQQQLRLHVQMLTQSFVQTYSHPDFWKLSLQAKNMLLELQTKAQEDASFNAWNLNGAVDLVEQWAQDLDKDTDENAEMMSFIHKEIDQTNRNTRQIPRFPPRIMDAMLSSSVFAYPQYLPRIPFTPKICSFHVFSPAESQLIALGLEKHMTRIRDSGERISKKASPLVIACERLSKDTVHGKTKRRIWDHVKTLRKTKCYNPVKYFFEHNCAPPIENKLLPFECNSVLPPKERFQDLPLAWQKYIERKRAEATTPRSAASRPAAAARLTTRATASEEARSAYLEFVREAVGETITLPENFAEASQPDGSITEEAETPTSSRKQAASSSRRSRQPKTPTSLTINVNYVFGAALNTGGPGGIGGVAFGATTPTSTTRNHYPDVSASQTLASSLNWTQLEGSTPLAASSDTSSAAIAYNYDYQSQTLDPIIAADEPESRISDRTQRKLTDFFNLESRNVSGCSSTQHAYATKRSKRFHKRHLPRLHSYFRIAARDHRAALHYRQKRLLQKHCGNLLHVYRQQLQTLGDGHRFSDVPLLRHCYRRFKSLELYTDLLIKLKMFCRQSAAQNTNDRHSPGGSGGGSLAKRSRLSAQQQQQMTVPQSPLDDEVVGSAATRGAAGHSKKANRQEENFRHMLLPDTAEDANRKDAIYAFNFYEKAEEVLKSSSRPEDCKKFNYILKSFDPKRGKVADLYYKLENLFLPDHPELAHVFLTFLLPPEAAEIGKFFEHFMVTNVATFINKLNVYFNKQPAQIRKIYNCLNELAEDANVTVKQIESKILPLLKGNQFLIDWFLQQFPEEPPPERLLSTPEHINLKEVQNNQCGEFMETVTDLLDSPTSEQQQSCQLKYINGRIFYGTKMTLPAKLSFMPSNYRSTSPEKQLEVIANNANSCIHGIREHGEKRLAAAAAAAECNSDDNDKSEEEDLSKALIIDTTAGEEDSSSSIETCDDATLRAHAIRLNPSYYSASFSATSTPNPGNSNTHQAPNHQNNHHANAKSKSSLNFNEEGKISPRKHGVLPPLSPIHTSASSSSLSTLTNATPALPYIVAVATTPAQLREKRKSPTKKNKSPICARTRVQCPLLPMVVIHEPSSAIACAKKLKSLIEADENGSVALEQPLSDCPTDSKDHLAIVARSKSTLRADANRLHDSNEHQAVSEMETCDPHLVAKIENTDDLEFLPEDANISQCAFPTMIMDLDSSLVETMESPANQQQQTQQQHLVSSSHIDSDEDSKLDVIATLASTVKNADPQTPTSSSSSCTGDCSNMPSSSSYSSSTTATTMLATSVSHAPQTAWTRDEDKIILTKMKLGSRNRDDLFQRIRSKLPKRALTEIIARYQFLMDFLSKLQRN